jgi:hypothetical protein
MYTWEWSSNGMNTKGGSCRFADLKVWMAQLLVKDVNCNGREHQVSDQSR